jgi:hypothetical protein
MVDSVQNYKVLSVSEVRWWYWLFGTPTRRVLLPCWYYLINAGVWLALAFRHPSRPVLFLAGVAFAANMCSFCDAVPDKD